MVPKTKGSPLNVLNFLVLFSLILVNNLKGGIQVIATRDRQKLHLHNVEAGQAFFCGSNN